MKPSRFLFLPIALFCSQAVPITAAGASWTVYGTTTPMVEGQEAQMQCIPDADDHPEYAIAAFFVVNAPGGPKGGANNSAGAFAAVRTPERTVSYRVDGEGTDTTLPYPDAAQFEWSTEPFQGHAARDSILKVFWATQGGAMHCAVTIDDEPVVVPHAVDATVFYVYPREFDGALSIEAGATIAHELSYTDGLRGDAAIFFLHGYGDHSWQGPEGQAYGHFATPQGPPFGVFLGPTDGAWTFRLRSALNASGVIPAVFAISVPEPDAPTI